MAEAGHTRQPPDLKSPEIQLPAVMSANEKRVRRGFWRKIGRVASRIPFAQSAIAAYYCATDPDTPLKAKAILFAALAYFVMPLDMVPDILTMIGFTDDAAVVFAALNIIGIYMKPKHQEMAQEMLQKLRKGDSSGPEPA
ncbi:YkvA family protein [Rhodoligotrophos ferricapiens]|uniref:YkvA family protein n=1 Tax=Rhodoligotrophos ferricapiens TaxID=3069264 RepID=UPI00315DAECA